MSYHVHMRPRKVVVPPTEEQMKVVHSRLLDGYPLEEALADVDIHRNKTYYWLGQFDLKLGPHRSTNRFLAREKWVRAAHKLIENGRSMKEIMVAASATRNQVSKAFRRYGLSQGSEAARNGKIERVKAKLPEILAALETEKPEAVARRFRISKVLFKEVVGEHVKPRSFSKVKNKIWLSEIPKDAAIASFYLIKAKKSTYEIEAKKYGKNARTLQGICSRRLGLKLVDRSACRWTSRVRKKHVIEAFHLAEERKRSIAASARLLGVSQSALRGFFIRLKLVDPVIEKLHPIPEPVCMTGTTQEKSLPLSL